MPPVARPQTTSTSPTCERCKQPSTTWMVGCVGEEQRCPGRGWFHYHCVGLAKREIPTATEQQHVTNMAEWSCQYCQSMADFALVCLIRSEYDRVVCASLIYGYLCNHFFSCRLWHVRNITQDQRLASCHTMYNAWQNMCRNIIKILNTVQSSWQFKFKLAPWQRS